MGLIDVITWKNDLGFLDLYVSDPKAMNWILSTQGYKYPMSEQRRRFLSNTIGDGILVAVGDVSSDGLNSKLSPQWSVESSSS